MEAKSMGQEDILADDVIAQAQELMMTEPASNWCCMHHALSLQEDFATEKLMLQHYIENWGHICMFLPKFHCELNLIEMLWGYAKYCESLTNFCFYYSSLINLNKYWNTSDGKFATAKQLVPKCLFLCNTLQFNTFSRNHGAIWRLICKFFMFGT